MTDFYRKCEELFVSDLDGTLLGPNGQITDYTRDAVSTFNRVGLPFTVASGRSFSSIRSALGRVPLSFPVVSSDGALVSYYDHPKPLWVKPMSLHPLAALLEDCVAAGLHPILDVWDGVDNFMGFSGVKNEGMSFFHDFKLKEESYIPRIDNRITKWLSHTTISLTLIDREESLADFRKSFEDRYAGIFKADGMGFSQIPGWGALWLQDVEARKEVALLQVLELLDWKPHRIRVFGDEMNDLGMFRQWHGVAVQNARAEILDASKEVIGPHFEDSVARYILGHGENWGLV